MFNPFTESPAACFGDHGYFRRCSAFKVTPGLHGAAQPPNPDTGTRSSPQLEQAGLLHLKIGFFNFDFHPAMMGPSSARKRGANFARVCSKLVEEGNWTSFSDARWVA